ncbi:MAG: D-alanyl-D-alanine carboxypeptidase [Lachnospiraceae bacterium]|nr:D-alanyl-D-alanine carboxypeptidase [Lachnospiraceae bacterium]
MAEESIFLSLDEEEVLRRKKAAYHAVMRRKNRKKRLVQARIRLAGLILFIVLIIGVLGFMIFKLVGVLQGPEKTTTEVSADPAFGTIERVIEPTVEEPEPEPEPESLQGPGTVYQAAVDEDKGVGRVTSEVFGSYAILVDKTEQKVIAGRDYQTRISPASMTKVLTLLVAVEHLTPAQLDEPYTILNEVTSFVYAHDCSEAGFLDDEVVTIRDLLYGTILPSGGDAALSLAYYIAGSHEAFVDLMNEKLAELGLSSTAHFTNCIGLYDEEHYCTPYDMAMIMCTAMDNELCREILSARKYLTSLTPEHPEGILLSNWFLRRIEDKDAGTVTVLGGKTGFVNESGNCAVSLATGDDGKEYVAVVANSRSAWRCIYDHVALYRQYFDPGYVEPAVEVPETEEELAEDSQAED